MKNFIRLLFVVAILLMVSGCSAEYNINIKSDLRIEENIKILEKNNYLYSICPYDLSVCINKDISDAKNQGLVKERYVTIIQQSSESGVNSLYVYDDFSAFKEGNILLNQFYNAMTMTVIGNDVNLNFDSIDTQYPSLNAVVGDDITGTLLSNFSLNIKVPYVVTINNADKVDKISNIYTWNYDSTTVSKDVILSFNKSKVFQTKITDIVKKAYKEGKLNSVFTIGIPLGIILGIIGFFAVINHRRNKV